MSHNESVIQWLIVAIIGMVAFLIGRSLFRKPSASKVVSGGAALESSEQIEALLGQLIERTQGWDAKGGGAVEIKASSGEKSSGSGSGKSVAGVPAVNSAELEQAKKELEQVKAALKAKDEELSQAKESDGGASDGGGGNNKALEEKITELEAKLAEYEVLEDDIADLSLYKEENARLKSELERLKGDEEPLESSGTIPEPEASDDLVKEFAEAVGKDAKEPVAESEAAEVPSELMAEPVEAAPVAEESISEPEPAPEEPASSEVEANEDLFAESASNDLDTDKVVSELAEIEKMAEGVSAEEALSEDVDPDKLAEEADDLKS